MFGFMLWVNNSNLGRDTDPEDVIRSLDYAEEVSRLTGLPVKFTSVREDLFPVLENQIRNLFPLKI
jgi:hypothetical protein